MAYRYTFNLADQTAANELEGRIDKLESDALRLLEEAAAIELKAKGLRTDAAHYTRIAGEYKALLGTAQRAHHKIVPVEAG